jgi:guanylate kinase
LWLSRSWTTRPRRPGESEDAYVFASDEEFRRHAEAGGFLEWAEFLGNCYGTPVPHPPAGLDILLEIDVQGAEQVVERIPDAVVILLLPPSDEVQRERLIARGDPAEQVRRRIEKGREEILRGRKLAAAEVVNHSVAQAVRDVADVVGVTRARRRTG